MSHAMLVLGLGKSGIAAARHILDAGGDLTIYAGKGTDATHVAGAEFENEGVDVVYDTETIEGSYDTCVISPGIPQTSVFYQNALAACEHVISEPEYAWRQSPEDWIAVTGTNGKTTTTSLITHLLNACGHLAVSCGNIGDTALEAVENRKDGQTLVVEMSSYQLASISHFAPRVAVLLNITPDHISWHGSFDEYAQAKFRIFENMVPGCGRSKDAPCAIVTREILDAYPERISQIETQGIRVIRVRVETESDCAYLGADGVLYVKDEAGNAHGLIRADELKIKGTHNVENALCAAAAVYASGCEIDCIAAGLKSFTPLEHRIEPCGTVDGVEFFNDSKATNVDATLKALTAFADRSVVLLLGGRDKGTDLRELVGACTGVASAVVAYGEAGARIYDAFASSSVDVYLEKNMRGAFERACAIARPGEAVVLSPACASFDEFDSFEQRGHVFKEYVNKLTKRL